jgi:transposase
MRSLSSTECNHILSLLDKGHSAHQISSTTGVSMSSIPRLRSKHCSTIFKSSGGHPPKLSSANICYPVHLIISGKAETAVEVSKTLSNITNQSISTDTVARMLKKTGMKAVLKKKRPLLTNRHRRERLDWALAHKDWTVEDWKRVIWSHETKINMFGSDGRKWSWKKAGDGLSDRLVEGTLKFGGGSVMIWGCMTWDRIRTACRIDGRIDGDLYVSILEDGVQGTMEYYGKTVDDIIFQQDNDPKHKYHKANSWLNDHKIDVLPWPA